MDSFLQQVAHTILAANAGRTHRTVVVFNNHRSAVFLRKEFTRISATAPQPFFLPRCMTIDEVVNLLGGLEIVRPEFLLFELYSIHIAMEGEARKYRTFEDFIPFGEMMMADFSDVDRYCVDASRLFDNLHNLKQIGEWNIDEPTLTPHQREYLHFYRSLYDYYVQLRGRLLEQKKAYAGMAYRHVAENISALSQRLDCDNVYFVGFNALSECERLIIGHFAAIGKGHLLTDSDAYYVADSNQEAGYFLRKHSKEFPEMISHAPSAFSQGNKRITLAECPENLMQCKYVGQLLTQHPDWIDTDESTAIVLADEKLLMPMLNSLPDKGKDGADYDVNISMGYPFADSRTHRYATLLIDVLRNRNANGYSVKDVTELLSSYLTVQLIDEDSPSVALSKWAQHEKALRCTTEEIVVVIGDSHPNTAKLLQTLLPTGEPTVEQALDALRQSAAKLVETSALERNKKEQQALAALVDIVGYISQLQTQYGYVETLNTLSALYRRIAQRYSITFLGQPLSGLQIMGMLETRNIDFKRVVLLSANEGILPAGRGNNTLIPYELKRAFNLPTYEEHDNVFAYHFYRLLQRAEEIYLIYSTESEAMGKGEPSRFLKQIKVELAQHFKDNITLHETTVNATPGVHTANGDEWGKKSRKALITMQQLATKGFSPSALSYYCQCPMQFYFKYVLHLRDNDTTEENMTLAQLGSCIHNSLLAIYQPFVGQAVTYEGLRLALDQLPTILSTVYDKELGRHRATTGQNHFYHKVAEAQIRGVVEREMQQIKSGNRIEIVGLEDVKEVDITPSDSPFVIKLQGRYDRIDRINGRLRIIDYKTGGLKKSDISLDMSKAEVGKMPSKWLQLMTYALIYRGDNRLAEPVLSGIYQLRNLNSDVQYASCNQAEEIDDLVLDDFKEMVLSLINEMFDQETPFAFTPRQQQCDFCPACRFCPQATSAPK